jgi:predicted NBD/HSP70 family sugar kinase
MQQQGHSVGHIRDLVDLALGGDPEARRLFRESARHIGEVLAGAVNLLNPEALVIAGDMSNSYDTLVAGLRETVYGNATALATRELQILPSTHGDRSGVIGSAAMILDHVLNARAVDAAL